MLHQITKARLHLLSITFTRFLKKETQQKSGNANESEKEMFQVPNLRHFSTVKLKAQVIRAKNSDLLMLLHLLLLDKN